MIFSLRPGSSNKVLIDNRSCNIFLSDMKCKPIHRHNISSVSPSRNTQHLVECQLTCSSGAKYVNRTQRQVNIRILGPSPAWLVRGEKKKSSSYILEHLVISGH
uniref:Uncharacterized protein n=1 Tax=Trichobilharzia regenti TaxID=157069 RepID=A0AA85K5U3_TRIRE|nr:unnamed protein product [Trichobilharzia regenti]